MVFISQYSIFIIFFIVYLIIWVTLAIGIVLMRNSNKFALKMHKLFLNGQIKKFQYPPFKNLLKVWLDNKYLTTSITFIFLIIIPAVILFFFCGIILITPILSIIQGFTVGILIGNFDKKNMLWAVIVGIFEFGYWALSGALGVFITLGFLFKDISFTDSFFNGIGVLYSGYWIPLVVCVLGNAFLEVAGPIYWNMTGLISLENLSQGKYINDDT